MRSYKSLTCTSYDVSLLVSYETLNLIECSALKIHMVAVWVIIKKIFSISLILNALITLAAIAQIIFNHYRSFPYWQPYSPFIVNGSVFFLVIVAAVLNIYPSASLGRTLHTGRFLFHHYVYGVFVLIFSAIFVMVFTPVSLIGLFLVYNESVTVNAGKFLFLVGFALLLDDLPDVSRKIGSNLNTLKAKVYRGRKIIHTLQFITGLFSFYVFLVVSLWATQNPSLLIPAAFTSSTFLITSLSSFVFVKRKAWLKIKPEE